MGWDKSPATRRSCQPDSFKLQRPLDGLTQFLPRLQEHSVVLTFYSDVRSDFQSVLSTSFYPFQQHDEHSGLAWSPVRSCTK